MKLKPKRVSACCREARLIDECRFHRSVSVDSRALATSATQISGCCDILRRGKRVPPITLVAAGPLFAARVLARFMEQTPRASFWDALEGIWGARLRATAARRAAGSPLLAPAR